MPHFFINSKNINSSQIIVDDKENYNHIAKSLRANIGEKLLLIDENRVEYTTNIKEITNKTIVCEIVSSEVSKRDLKYNLFLAQSPLKSDAQLTIMEKATELGVRGIYPIYTDNCALKKTVAEHKVEKWQKVMYEASKQCERATIPTCFELTTLEKVLTENILLIIGPEGGFSTSEFQLFKDKNFPMLSLGDLILKAETAVIMTLGNVVYEYGEW